MFTLDEARRALPLVRRIAADLQEAVSTLSEFPGGTAFLYGATPLDELDPAVQPKAADLRQRIEDLSAELTEIGVELKGFQPVLVDFLSWRNEDKVYLCWAEGEDDILNWHSLSEGYRGRQPL